MATSTAAKTIRILTLPGYTQNAHIMSKKMGAVRKGVGKNIEFVFVDPPHIVLNPTFGGSLADFDSTASSDPEELTPETTPRSWWEKDNKGPDWEVFKGFDESVQCLREFIRKDEEEGRGGFDGVLGFSQGAGMAALLVSLTERPSLHPVFAAEPHAKPFKFAIFVGGFVPNPKTPNLKPYFPLGPTPTLHVIGRNDVIISDERSVQLAELCDDSRIERHDGGHFVPSKPGFRNFFKEYINSFTEGGLQGDVPSPAPHVLQTPTPGSTPVGSGGNTPQKL